MAGSQRPSIHITLDGNRDWLVTACAAKCVHVGVGRYKGKERGGENEQRKAAGTQHATSHPTGRMLTTSAAHSVQVRRRRKHRDEKERKNQCDRSTLSIQSLSNDQRARATLRLCSLPANRQCAAPAHHDPSSPAYHWIGWLAG